MKPIYWVLIGVGVVAFVMIKMYFVQKWMAARQERERRRQEMAE